MSFMIKGGFEPGSPRPVQHLQWLLGALQLRPASNTFSFLPSASARDKSEKAFGMAFVKLMNADGTTLQDGRHNLIVYKVLLSFSFLNLGDIVEPVRISSLHSGSVQTTH